jgi:hypothetical protein
MFKCSFATLDQAYGDERMSLEKIKADMEKQERIKKEKAEKAEKARIEREKKLRNEVSDSESDSEDISDSYTKIDLVVN